MAAFRKASTPDLRYLERQSNRCGLYAEEYKSWIAQATATPQVVEVLNTFKTFWADKITIVN